MSTFLKFNKIKTLLEEKGLEIGEVIKAVNGSELLEVLKSLLLCCSIKRRDSYKGAVVLLYTVCGINWYRVFTGCTLTKTNVWIHFFI